MNTEKVEQEQEIKLPAEHSGLPAKDPQTQRAQVGRQKTARDRSSEMSLHLPHERDQSTSMTTDQQSPVIKQAFNDDALGRVDTSKQPEMNDAYDRLKRD